MAEGDKNTKKIEIADENLGSKNLNKLEDAGKGIMIAIVVSIVPLFIILLIWLTIAGVWASQNAAKPSKADNPNKYVWPFYEYKRSRNQAPPYAIVDTGDII